MRKLLTFLFALSTVAGLSQGVTITVGEPTAPDADKLNGKDAAFYVDTLNNQNIEGLKIFKDDLVLDSTLSIGISVPDGSSILDITSTTKGFLPPRMTTVQRDAIGSSATGLSIYNTTNNDPNFFNGSAWRRVTHVPGASLKNGGIMYSTGVSSLENDSANFFWDSSAKELGIGTATPSQKLEVNGNIKSDTVFSDIFQSNMAVSSIRDSLVTKCECSHIVDDGTIVLPDATTQDLKVWIDGDDEWALAAIQANGTVTLPATVGSVINTDTDANLCIYDSGTGATIKNRLGSSKVICYESKYKQ